jgi:hypothetical protein|tara:strand:+ start:233 stop:487 length:255 start_codon:yes stop_codon:yes gene_type:complete
MIDLSDRIILVGIGDASTSHTGLKTLDVKRDVEAFLDGDMLPMHEWWRYRVTYDKSHFGTGVRNLLSVEVTEGPQKLPMGFSNV